LGRFGQATEWSQGLPTTIYSEQFFNRHLAGSLASARIVLKELFDVASIKSVIDVGCGLGAWLRAAKECGADKVIGLDGDYVDHTQLLIESSCFRCCNIEIEDLRSATAGHIPFDVAISMEVAEHLPLDRARSFVTELCSLSDLVLFSAAIPGQGGINHVNEQWPDYWSGIFSDNGFACFDVLRPSFWQREECEWWYRQNALLFARRDAHAFAVAARLGAPTRTPMALVHPAMMSHSVAWSGERIAELEALVRCQPFGRDAAIRALEAKVDKLRTMATDKRSELELLHGQCEQLSAEDAAMRASTSWRITAPLRRVAKLLGR
jgi:hypothetical protein